MAGPKDTANSLGDAWQDASQLTHADNPDDLEHGASQVLRDLGLGSVADELDHLAGQFHGVLPDPQFALYWGKGSPMEQLAGEAEGFAHDLLDHTGFLGGIAGDLLHRGETELESRLKGQATSIWGVNTFDLQEALSTPWTCKMLLHTKEKAADITAPGGLLGSVTGLLNDVKSGNVENVIGDVTGMLGIANPDPFAGSQNPPPADAHVPQKGQALDPADYLNQPLSISFGRLAEKTKGVPVVERWLTGVVTEFQDLGASRDVRFITVTVRPAFYTLAMRHDCRIFQEMNAIEIVRAVFGAAGIYGCGTTENALAPVDNLIGSSAIHGALAKVDSLLDQVRLFPPAKVARGDWTPKRQMCVQYNETDMDFVQRLLDEEGITYYFDCEKRTERIVFIDDPFQLDKCRTTDGHDVPFARADEIAYQHPKGTANRADDATERRAQPEVLWEMSLAQRRRANKFTLRDYNFRLAGMGVPADRAPTAGGQTPYQQEVNSGVNNGTVLQPNYQLGKSGWQRSTDDSAAVERYLVPATLYGPLDGAGGDIKTDAYTPDGHSPEDPSARMTDVLRSQTEVGTGEGNVLELRAGRLVSVKGFLSYRNNLSGFDQALNADLTPPNPATDPNAFATWDATQQSLKQSRAGRDAEYAKPYLLLVTRSHVSAKGQDVATWPPPPQVTGSETVWDATKSTQATGLMALVSTGTDGAHTTKAIKTAAPGMPIPTYTPPGDGGDLSAQSFFSSFEFVIVDSDAASKGAGAQNAGFPLRYRPTPKIPRPRILGLQTAQVVDVDNHYHSDLKQQLELDTNAYRVRLHMHWDRRGDKITDRRKSTCWVRMTTPWAGSDDARDWGTMFVPRAGMEVVVGFVDGDPERPVVLGAVPNSLKQPAVVALPQPVVKRTPPDGTEGDPVPVIADDPAVDPSQPVSLFNEVHRNRSVIRTLSEPLTDGATGSWIVFDDNYPNEWLQLRSQDLLMKEVLHDYKVNVGTYESPYTDTHKQVLAVGVDYAETVDGDAWLTVSDTRNFTVKGAEARVNFHADHATYIIGDEWTKVERGRSATIDGFETMILGPTQIDTAEPPTEPRMKMTVHGSSLLTVKNHEGKTPPNGDDKLHVRLDKTDTIFGKLTMDAKGGLQIGAHPAQGAPGGTAGAAGAPAAPTDPGKDTHISAGVPPRTGTLELASQDEINLSSEGIMKIRSDHNDIHFSGDKYVQVTAQSETLKLILGNPADPAPDKQTVVLSGTATSGGKRVRFLVGDGSGMPSELIVGDDGIKLTLPGSTDEKTTSLEITKAGEIKLKGGILKMVAKNNVNLSGQVVFKPK